MLAIDKAQEDFNQIIPLAFGELDGGNGGYDLGGKVSSLGTGGTKGQQGILLDLGLDIVAECKPSCAVLCLPGRLL